MQIHYVGRNIEVTPAIKAFVEEKIQRLEHRQNNITKIDIIFQVDHLTHVAEANLHVPRIGIINATGKAKDMYIAIEELIDKLLVQINKHKDKQTDHHR